MARGNGAEGSGEISDCDCCARDEWGVLEGAALRYIPHECESKEKPINTLHALRGKWHEKEAPRSRKRLQGTLRDAAPPNPRARLTLDRGCGAL